MFFEQIREAKHCDSVDSQSFVCFFLSGRFTGRIINHALLINDAQGYNGSPFFFNHPPNQTYWRFSQTYFPSWKLKLSASNQECFLAKINGSVGVLDSGTTHTHCFFSFRIALRSPNNFIISRLSSRHATLGHLLVIGSLVKADHNCRKKKVSLLKERKATTEYSRRVNTRF